MKKILKIVGILAGIGIVLVAVMFTSLPWMDHWGATTAEIAASFTGDELVRSPRLTYTRAISIDARPEAIYPWIVPYERQGQKLEDFPHLERWFAAVRARPAVVRAYEKAKEINPNPPGIRTAEERAVLFGQTAASVARAAARAG